jgi:hypothetical protein
MTDAYNWAAYFGEMFVDCCEAYEDGHKDYDQWFEPDGLAFLKSIGAKPREIFDYVASIMWKIVSLPRAVNLPRRRHCS